MKKSGGIIYFFGSVGLIVVAIAVTSFIERSRATNIGDDTRVRASNQSSLQMTGTITSVDSINKILTVTSLKFTDKNAKDLGTWTVHIDPGVKMGSLVSGKTVNLGVDAGSFSIEHHTLTALAIH